MSFRKFNARGEELRRAIAQEAARIMNEHGIEDYLLAKRKAAERLGVTDTASLPRNTEIEAALIEYQRLFAADTHSQTLAEQRRAALAAMQLLAEFEPRLVGPVLSGTATPHADIDLHVFADQPEAVAFKLMDRGIPHEVLERRVKMHTDRAVAYPAVRFSAGDRTIDATVFPVDGIRQAPFSPVDGRPMRRAAIGELAALLEE
jgi:predicted component of type VI protein secretion system